LGMQELIRIGVLIPPAGPLDLEGAAPIKVPVWVKTTAKWWVEDKVTDDDFRNSVRFLVEKGIIII